MKPILQHLEELPEPYRTQAIENYENPELEFPKRKAACKTVMDALEVAFDWERSPQGNDYWGECWVECKSRLSKPKETLQHFNERQIHAIEYHRYMLGTRWGRSPTILEAFLDWVDSGFAEQFRNGEIGKEDES